MIQTAKCTARPFWPWLSFLFEGAPTNNGSPYLVGKLIKIGSLHRLIDGTLIKKIDLLYGWFIFGEANFSLLFGRDAKRDITKR